MIESSIRILDQNRYLVDTSLIHLESCKSPTAELFDVDSGRISIVIVNTKEYHSDVLAIITRIMRRTLDNSLFGDVARQRPPISVINVTPRVVLLPSYPSLHSPGFADIILQLLGWIKWQRLAPGGNTIELSVGRQSLLPGGRVLVAICDLYLS
ncbi:hypothetical protein Tco_0506767 [Tanacetum coccineum]